VVGGKKGWARRGTRLPPRLDDVVLKHVRLPHLRYNLLSRCQSSSVVKRVQPIDLLMPETLHHSALALVPASGREASSRILYEPVQHELESRAAVRWLAMAPWTRL
jgi:hypothetical protein